EFYDLLNQMLGELHVSHLSVRPLTDNNREPAVGGVRIDIRLLDGVPIITRVEPGSTAAKAGLRQGFEIEAIDGLSIEQIAAKTAHRELTPAIKLATITQDVLDSFGGGAGTVVMLVYRDRNGSRHEAEVVREKRSGDIIRLGKDLPSLYLEFESRRLDS